MSSGTADKRTLQERNNLPTQDTLPDPFPINSSSFLTSKERTSSQMGEIASTNTTHVNFVVFSLKQQHKFSCTNKLIQAGGVTTIFSKGHSLIRIPFHHQNSIGCVKDTTYFRGTAWPKHRILFHQQYLLLEVLRLRYSLIINITLIVLFSTNTAPLSEFQSYYVAWHEHNYH